MEEGCTTLATVVCASDLQNKSVNAMISARNSVTQASQALLPIEHMRGIQMAHDTDVMHAANANGSSNE
jgi:hypothetical protein